MLIVADFILSKGNHLNDYDYSLPLNANGVRGPRSKPISQQQVLLRHVYIVAHSVHHLLIFDKQYSLLTFL